MANVTGIAITIKAFLPTGKTLDEQFAALSAVKTAHETGDYAALLAVAKIEGVKTEQKTRRIEDTPAAPAANSHGIGPDTDGDAIEATDPGPEADADFSEVADYDPANTASGAKKKSARAA